MVREFVELKLIGEKQMTEMATFTGASSAKETSKSCDNIPWLKAKNLVIRLQMRIAKAAR